MFFFFLYINVVIGKKDDVADFEKKLEECNEQFKILMSPEGAQVQKSAICRYITK